MKAYDAMVHWVREREAIRVDKEKGFPRPWTADLILRKWRFCNVRREDDVVTKWIADNIRRPYVDHPLLWLMLCLARQINLPSTLQALMCMYPGAWPGDDNFTPQHLADALEDRASMGLKNYTGVYVISAPAEKGRKKTDYTAFDVIGSLYSDRKYLSDFVTGDMRSMQRFHGLLMKYPGWGPFLAYQAIVDMRFTHIFENAIDVKTWIAAGPGTLRGLNRIHGRPFHQDEASLKAPSIQLRCKGECLVLWPKLMKDTGVTMDLSDVPNVCCETDKYLRVMNGEGFPRNEYKQAPKATDQDLF